MKGQITLDYVFDRCIPEPNSGCWYWIASSLNTKGYPQIRYNGKFRLVSRLVLELTHGPLGDLMALHRCDTPSCVNPDHLFAGTAFDNMQDMVRKKRHGGRAGEANNDAHLTEAQVVEILKSDVLTTNVALAERYGVSKCTVRCVRNRVTWKHVLPDVPPRPKTVGSYSGVRLAAGWPN